MTRIRRLALLTTACLISTGAAQAQTYRPEGKTASGACVNPALAASARLDAKIFSQPKISLTAYPLLPSGDYSYRYPHNLIPDLNKPSQVGIPIPPPSP